MEAPAMVLTNCFRFIFYKKSKLCFHSLPQKAFKKLFYFQPGFCFIAGFCANEFNGIGHR